MVEPVDFRGAKQIKDSRALSQARATLFFVGFALALGGLGLAYGWFTLGLWGAVACLLLGLTAALAATKVFVYITEGVSGNIGRIIYMGRRSHWSLRERLAADIQQVRCDKANERHAQALSRLELVLKKDPAFPEALYLKAEILWEALRDADQAQSLLIKVVNLTQPTDQHHVWARTLYKKISQATKS